mgnify:CR=1 FL=1
MGKHVSEQSRHLKTKDEPQNFPEIDEIDEESRGAKKAKRGFANCGSISFGGIAPVVFSAVLLAALSFLLAEGWMKCVAFLIPFVIAGFAILMDAIDKLIDRKYFEAEQITLIAAIAVFALGFAPTVIFEIIIASYVSVNVMSYIYALFGMLLLGSALIAIGMFISSLTESSVISAILTLVINILVLYMSNFASMINVSWIAAAVEKAAFISAAENFGESVLSVPDILYFVSISAAFLFLCVRSLDKRRWA